MTEGRNSLVDEMVVRSAIAMERQRKQIVDYPAKHFPKTPALQTARGPR